MYRVDRPVSGPVLRAVLEIKGLVVNHRESGIRWHGGTAVFCDRSPAGAATDAPEQISVSPSVEPVHVTTQSALFSLERDQKPLHERRNSRERKYVGKVTANYANFMILIQLKFSKIHVLIAC